MSGAIHGLESQLVVEVQAVSVVVEGKEVTAAVSVHQAPAVDQDHHQNLQGRLPLRVVNVIAMHRKNVSRLERLLRVEAEVHPSKNAMLQVSLDKTSNQ